MNKLTIIGNLTKDPETRSTPTGRSVCNFAVAVNRRNGGDPDYFRVSAWDKCGENCQKYLTKGKKVCVIGPVSLDQYISQNGENRANMLITAQDVEFLSGKTDNAPETANNGGYTPVETPEGLPF